MSNPTEKVEVPYELIEAVAMVGVDFGYGEFVLNDEHIETARRIVERYKESNE